MATRKRTPASPLKMVIKVGKKEETVTIKEAEALYEHLHQLFGNQMTLPGIHVIGAGQGEGKKIA